MKASNWISVKDRLPKIGERVIACQSFNDGSTFVRMATRIKTNKIEWWYDDDGFGIDKITHWQEIVLPKKEK